MNIYLAITIDTECDKGEKWKVKQPLSFKNTREGILNNLQPIIDKYSAKATYLLSPEVINDNPSVAVFKDLSDRSELGTHLHAEFIEPEANLSSTNTNHYQSDFPENIEFKKLQNLTNLFKEKFGYQPTSFRAGRFGISRKSLLFLENLGYLVDSSVTPDMQWHNTNGNTVNYFGAPYQPYHPDKHDFRKKGNMRLIQFPVSVYHPSLLNRSPALKRQIRLNNRYHHILFNYLTGFKKQIWLRPTFSKVEELKDVTNKLIAKQQNQNTFFCMMFHSNEYELGMSPYSLTKPDLQQNMQRLDGYLAWLTNTHTVKFIGLSDCITYPRC
jgi:hypothetical protein